MMHPDLEKLLQLEETDREIARLRAEVAALPRRVAEIETKLAGVNASVDKARTALKDIEKNRRKHEADIQTLQQKISKYRDQMLAVKTNQEYKALGSEIAHAEQEIRSIEDKILEGMLQAETREAELKANEAEHKRQQAAVEKEKSEARICTEQDQKRMAELQPQREALRQGIAPELVRHYDRVRKLRGSALAEVRDQYCMACQVMLRPQVYNDVRGDQQVLTCDSCNRILYFNPANAAPEPAPGSSDRKEVLEPAAAETPDAS